MLGAIISYILYVSYMSKRILGLRFNQAKIDENIIFSW